MVVRVDDRKVGVELVFIAFMVSPFHDGPPRLPCLRFGLINLEVEVGNVEDLLDIDYDNIILVFGQSLEGVSEYAFIKRG